MGNLTADLQLLERVVRGAVREREEREERERARSRAVVLASVNRVERILAAHAPWVCSEVRRLDADFMKLASSASWRRLARLQAAVHDRRDGAILVPPLFVDWRRTQAGFEGEGGDDCATWFVWSLGAELTLTRFARYKWFPRSSDRIGRFRRLGGLSQLRTCMTVGAGLGDRRLTHGENRTWLLADARAALVLCAVSLLHVIADRSLLGRVVARTRRDAEGRLPPWW